MKSNRFKRNQIRSNKIKTNLNSYLFSSYVSQSATNMHTRRILQRVQRPSFLRHIVRYGVHVDWFLFCAWGGSEGEEEWE